MFLFFLHLVLSTEPWEKFRNSLRKVIMEPKAGRNENRYQQIDGGRKRWKGTPFFE